MNLINFTKLKKKIKLLYLNKYSNLLFGFISLLLLYSFLDGRLIFNRIFMSFLFIINIFLVLRTLSLPRKINFYLTIFAVSSFFLNVINLTLNIGQSKTILITINYILYIIYLSGSILIFSKHIFLTKKVTADILKGGISLYLMIGFLWHLFYNLILFFDSEAFSIVIDRLSTHQLIYFSFTTLTTIGYGDISPVSRIAMVFTNLEGIIGQMFPAIFIARLVSLYQNEQ